jgi:xanthine dehydrogenase YagT iron-sulfur-binding subunit
MKRDRSDDGRTRCRCGITRRRFLSTVGMGAMAVAASGSICLDGQAAAAQHSTDSKNLIPLTLDVNDRIHRLLVKPRWSLLFILRERLGLTGTKVGCERGECGACTVLINNAPQYACMILGVEGEGFKITTVEGIMSGEMLGPVQQAFLEQDALQCGYCTPGQIMAVEGLLRQNPSPSMQEIRSSVSGNLCRCGAYVHIFEAAKRAAELRKGRS